MIAKEVAEEEMGLVELSRLDWEQMSEVGWWELVGLGLPSQLGELAIDMSRRSGRRLRAYAMATLDAGVPGLAVPFVDEDGIIFDPSFFDNTDELPNVIAHELAYLLYPGWINPGIEDYDEMERFAQMLGSIILEHLPSNVTDADPLVEVALSNQQAA